MPRPSAESLTIPRMEVPGCSGLTSVAQYALGRAESTMPLTNVNFAIGGEGRVTSPLISLLSRPRAGD